MSIVSSVVLRKIADQIEEELLNTPWPSDWYSELSDRRERFKSLRVSASQTLGRTKNFFSETEPNTPEEPDHLQEKNALESAMKKAVKLLRDYASSSESSHT